MVFKITAKKLTISSILLMDMDSVPLNQEDIPVLKLLKDRAQLLSDKPVSMIHLKHHFVSQQLKKDNVVYYQVRTDQFDGFVAPEVYGRKNRMNIILEKARERLEKSRDEGDADTPVVSEAELIRANEEKELKKFGQVQPFPTKWKWQFPWLEGKCTTPTLKRILQGKTVHSYLELDTVHQQEIADHVLVELFIYFRRSIPPRYLNLVLAEFIMTFPFLEDKQSNTGYVSTSRLKTET